MTEPGEDLQETDIQTAESDVVQQHPGELLAQAREAQGLSRIRVSELLGLTQSAIRDIELNRFEKFPSGIYVRGYLRNYCKLVAVDEKKIMDAYDQFGETNEVPEESPFGSAALLEASQSTGKQRVTIFVIVAALLIAGIAALIVLK